MFAGRGYGRVPVFHTRQWRVDTRQLCYESVAQQDYRNGHAVFLLHEKGQEQPAVCFGLNNFKRVARSISMLSFCLVLFCVSNFEHTHKLSSKRVIFLTNETFDRLRALARRVAVLGHIAVIVDVADTSPCPLPLPKIATHLSFKP